MDVAIEKSYKLKVNDVHIATFFASPQELRELATGFLLCGGNVWSPDEITSTEVGDGAIVCEIRDNAHGVTEEIRPISSTVRFERKVIFDAIGEFKRRGTSWWRDSLARVLAMPFHDVCNLAHTG